MLRKEKRGVKEEKKGLSPVIATVMLVAMVVALGLIIFLWFRGFTEESVTKFGGTNIKLVCADIRFESSYSGGILSLENTGNVPIYSFKIKVDSTGGYETLNVEDITSIWPEVGLNQGGIFSDDISGGISGSPTQITIIPVLRGKSNSGAVGTYVCEEQYGEVVLLD